METRLPVVLAILLAYPIGLIIACEQSALIWLPISCLNTHSSKSVTKKNTEITQKPENKVTAYPGSEINNYPNPSCPYTYPRQYPGPSPYPYRPSYPYPYPPYYPYPRPYPCPSSYPYRPSYPYPYYPYGTSTAGPAESTSTSRSVSKSTTTTGGAQTESHSSSVASTTGGARYPGTNEPCNTGGVPYTYDGSDDIGYGGNEGTVAVSGDQAPYSEEQSGPYPGTPCSEEQGEEYYPGSPTYTSAGAGSATAHTNPDGSTYSAANSGAQSSSTSPETVFRKRRSIESARGLVAKSRQRRSSARAVSSESTF